MTTVLALALALACLPFANALNLIKMMKFFFLSYYCCSASKCAQTTETKETMPC